MSYLTFLIYFIVAPAAILAALLHALPARATESRFFLRRHWLGTGILALIALIWTTPWDNWIVARGVWSYGVDRVLGTIGVVPLEEYAFMILMPFLNAGFIALLIRQNGVSPTRWRDKQTVGRAWALGLAAVAWLGGFWILFSGGSLYLGAILIWFVPPLAIQACFDPACLWAHRRGIAMGTLIPTLYLATVDHYAIAQGIWTIHESTRSGLEIFGLPFEEAFFFYVTSLLISQGLYLWHSLFRRNEI